MNTTDEWGPREQKPQKQRRWPRRIAWIAGGLFAFLFILYFVATSSPFLKVVVLPIAGSKLDAKIQADSISLHTFSSVRIKGLSFKGRKANEPLLTVEEVAARYSLMDIIGGKINVETVTIRSPVIQILEYADGSANWDFLRKGGDATNASEEPKPSNPTQIALKSFQLENATARYIKRLATGKEERAEISGLNISLSNLRNGDSASMHIAAAAQFERPVTNGRDLVQAELSGDVDCALTAGLQPEQIQGKISLRVPRGEHTFAELGGVETVLNCRLTPSDLEEFSVEVLRAGKKLATLTANGPFNAAAEEGKLKVALRGIDREFLNLAGAPMGIDFGTTTIASEHILDLADGGKSLSAKGELKINQLSAIRDRKATKPVDFAVQYELGLNRNENSGRLKSLTLAGTKDMVPFLQGGIQQPVRFSFGPPATFSDSQFTLSITNLDFADWQSLLGDVRGKANLGLNVVASESGKRLAFALDSQLADAAAMAGSNRFDHLNVALGIKGEVKDLTSVTVPGIDIRLAHRNQEVLALSGSANYQLSTHKGDAKLDLAASVPRTLQLAGLTNLALSSGTLKLKTSLSQTAVTTVAGDLQLSELNGSVGTLPLKNLEAAVDWNASMDKAAVRLAKLGCAFKQNGVNAGSVQITGAYAISNKAGNADLALAAINEQLLKTFLPECESVSVSGNLAARYAPVGESSVRGDIHLANLKLTNAPKDTLDLTLKVDCGVLTNLLALREVSTVLRCNDRPAANVGIAGSYDLSNQVARLHCKLTNLNEHALLPFVPAAAESLRSVSVNADLAAVYDARQQSSIKGEISITNLAARTGAPLSAAVNLEGAFSNQVVSLQALKLKLDPTERARNQLLISGQVNLANPKAIAGNLDITSESLDLTRYYQTFAPATNASPTASTNPVAQTASSAPASSSKPQAEPEPVELPFQDFAVNAAIDRLYLQEIHVGELLGKVKLTKFKVNADPLRLTLNGAPFNLVADVNLQNPGYEYRVNLAAERIPLEPIVNTFQPDMRGKVKAFLVAHANIRGAGITGPNLRKNLNGPIDFQLQNANLKFVRENLLTKILRPVSFVLGVPELVNTPLNSIALAAEVVSGKAQVKQANVTSDSYIFDTQGDLLLDDVLENSKIQSWPAQLQIRRALALKATFTKKASGEGDYTKTPDFLRIGGTLADPKPEINKTAVAGSLLQRLNPLSGPK